MKVFVLPAAAETVRSLPPQTKKTIKKAMLSLPTDPLGHKGALNVKKLTGHVDAAPIYRLRVGTWRIVFRINGPRIEILQVFPRSEGYGWMERVGF